MPHPDESVDIPETWVLYHSRVVHFEGFFPPEEIYQQCTDGMTKRIKLQQTNGNTLGDFKVVSAWLDPYVLSRGSSKFISYVRRVIHCAMNHKAWIQTRDFASGLALLFD